MKQSAPREGGGGGGGSVADSGSEMMRRKQVQTGEVEGELGEKHRNGGQEGAPAHAGLGGVRKPGGGEGKGGRCGKTPPPIRSGQHRERGRHPAPPPSMNRRYVPKGVLPVTS